MFLHIQKKLRGTFYILVKEVNNMIKFDNIQIKYGDFIAIDNLNLDIESFGRFSRPFIWKY